MKKFTLGQNLLIIYAAFILLFTFLKVSFFFGLIYVTYPFQYLLLLLPNDGSSFVAFCAQSLSQNGFYAAMALVQGIVLYFGGNWIEKVLNRR